MEPRISPDDFEKAKEQARKDQQTFPDDFRPSVRMVAARNMIQDAIGGSMGSAESVELTPFNQTEDGVWFGITVRQDPGQRSINSRVSLIAGYAGLKIHVLEDGEVPDDVDRDDVDRDDLPQLTYRVFR
jgi:hypothetical protein